MNNQTVSEAAKKAARKFVSEGIVILFGKQEWNLDIDTINFIEESFQSAIDSAGTNWTRTSDRPPTENDADETEKVFVHELYNITAPQAVYWEQALNWPFWMKIPPVPDEKIAKKDLGER